MWSKVMTGSVAGFLATAPMSIWMFVAHRRLPAGERQDLPPDRITRRLRSEAGVARETRWAQGPLTAAAHFAYGAFMGAVYVSLLGRRGPLFKGPAFGLAVWTISYLGWLPAARILPPATQESARRNGLMIAAHLIWGASLQFCARLLLGTRPEARD